VRKIYYSLDFQPYLTYLLKQPLSDNWYSDVQKFCDDIVFVFFNLIGIISRKIVRNPNCFRSALSAKIAHNPETLIGHADSIVIHVGAVKDSKLLKKALESLQLVDYQKIALTLHKQSLDIDKEQQLYDVPLRIIDNKTRRRRDKRVVYGLDPGGGGESDSSALAARIANNLNASNFAQIKHAASRSNEAFLNYMKAWVTKMLDDHIEKNLWIRQFISYLSQCEE